MSAIILAGDIVHYEVLGRGRPLVFLHGWVGSWRYWIPAMQASSPMFRAYALDQWGFGDSAKQEAQYALNNQVQLLESFLHELGIGKISLVGHGLGGVLSLLYANRHPERVDRLAVVSLPMAGQTIHPRLSNATPGELSDWLLGSDPIHEAVRAEAPKTDLQAIRDSLADLQEKPLHTHSLTVDTPCLLVHGRNDPLVPIPSKDQFDRLPEHIHQITFDESGHFPMLDETNKFNRLLMDFLALDSGDSPRKLQLKEEWKRRVR